MVRKTYTREFKLKVVPAVEAGELRPAQACREYQIAESGRNRWRHEVRLRGSPAAFPHSPRRRPLPITRRGSLNWSGFVVNWLWRMPP